MKYILKITDNTFYHVNLYDIPTDCTELHIVGEHLNCGVLHWKENQIECTEISILNLVWHLHSYQKQLKVLDLSGCKNVKSIRNGFERLLSIETLILPPKVSECPTIQDCPNLTTLIGDGLTNIRRVYECPLLENVKFNKSLDQICLPNTSIRKICLPNVTEIEPRAFENCENLVEVEFSDNIIKIGNNAFKNCKSLYSIMLPDKCDVKSDAFSGCTSLKHIKLPNDLVKIESGTFADCTNLKIIKGGRNIKELCNKSFLNCKSIKYLPFVPKVIDSETFEINNKEMMGIVLYTNYIHTIIWCFNTLSFFYSDEKIDIKQKDRIVTFDTGSRYSLSSVDNGSIISMHPCQIAINIVSSNFDETYYKEVLDKHRMIPSVFPKLSCLHKEVTDHVNSLDIAEIISSYNTYAHEFQTWRIGGDNSFYHEIKTSIIYTDAYIESLLPNIHEEYSESACHDYSSDIDEHIQDKYKLSDSMLKSEAISKYDKDKHIEVLMDDYIKSYISNNAYVEKHFHINFARNVVKHFVSSAYVNGWDMVNKFSILCDGSTPPINYKDWLYSRYLARKFRH